MRPIVNMFTIENVWRLKQQCRKTRDFIQGHTHSVWFVCCVLNILSVLCSYIAALHMRLQQAAATRISNWKWIRERIVNLKIITRSPSFKAKYFLLTKWKVFSILMLASHILYVHNTHNYNDERVVWYHFMRLHCSRTFKKGWLRETQCVSCNPRFICNVPILSLRHLRWNLYTVSLSPSLYEHLFSIDIEQSSHENDRNRSNNRIETPQWNHMNRFESGRMCRSRQNKIIVIWCHFFGETIVEVFFLCFTWKFRIHLFSVSYFMAGILIDSKKKTFHII